MVICRRAESVRTVRAEQQSSAFGDSPVSRPWIQEEAFLLGSSLYALSPGVQGKDLHPEARMEDFGYWCELASIAEGC